jgi:NADH-quinone oxidoreductase subunit E
MTILLSYKTKQAIDACLEKFPVDQKQSAVLFALRTVQAEQGGHLMPDAMDAVAAYLGMPKIAVYEVASFYDHFNLEPVGRHTISICTNISCLLRDAEGMLAHLEKRLNIACGQTTADGRFTLKSVECLAACGGAPVMHIDEQYYEHLTPQSIDALLEGLE